MDNSIVIPGEYRVGEQNKSARLELNGQSYLLPIIKGSENEKAIDITNLRRMTSHITLDAGYQNTGSCASSITYIDGEKGILRYRGIPIEEIAQKATFIDTAYLLIYGHLPKKNELSSFSKILTENSMLHEDMVSFFNRMPQNGHPMAILSSMINSLSLFYPMVAVGEEESNESVDITIARLISKIRTIAAFSYKKSIGEPFVYPTQNNRYVENFLHMMFASPVNNYMLDHVVVKALNTLLIIHADHEQNCSTSTVRLVGSSQVNLYASICAGICALWGPLHGGANQKVIESLEAIKSSTLSVKKYLDKVKDKKDSTKLMGFGHRVYKNYDPRATIIKGICRDLLEHLNLEDSLFDIAMELEEQALTDEYFIERKLYPNVDFYSGIIYKAMGIPTNMFTVMFAMGRLPGWIAQWKEMHDSSPLKIGRPRQVYIGKNKSEFVSMKNR